MPKVLLIRADASVAMGTGHVMRMIALAQAWQQSGGNSSFVCAEITPTLEERIRDEDFGVENITTAPGSREDLAATRATVTVPCSNPVGWTEKPAAAARRTRA